jgi:membrane-bound lytic murein transglycosylase D
MGMGRDLFGRKTLNLPLCTFLLETAFLLAAPAVGRADPGVTAGAAETCPLPVRSEQIGRTGHVDQESQVGLESQRDRAEQDVPAPAVDGDNNDCWNDGQPAAVLHDRSSGPLLELGFPDRPSVQHWRKRFLAWGTPALQEPVDRGRTFRRFISAELAERGLPQELVYLPALESLYRVRAVSRSGATGLWQIMNNTSAPLGLLTDRWVDERRDFWKSTEGALRKLEENYAAFGDWDLALAAYNCGTGLMSRTIRSTGVRDFWTLREQGALPPETSEYVPKFHALVSIFSDPTACGLKVSWQRAPIWQRIPLDRTVELALLAEKADLPLDLMEEAHAELQTPITPPVSARPYHLKIPLEYVERVGTLLADPEVQLLRYTFHTIRSGDTYYALAEYYELSPALLMEANPSFSPRGLKIGSQLRIPVFCGRPPKPEPIVSLSDEEAAAFTVRHTVVTGDTLWGISRRYGTTAEILAWVNGLSLDAPLKPGETLKVPPPAEQAAEQTTDNQQLPAQTEEGEIR